MVVISGIHLSTFLFTRYDFLYSHFFLVNCKSSFEEIWKTVNLSDLHICRLLKVQTFHSHSRDYQIWIHTHIRSGSLQNHYYHFSRQNIQIVIFNIFIQKCRKDATNKKPIERHYLLSLPYGTIWIIKFFVETVTSIDMLSGIFPYLECNLVVGAIFGRNCLNYSVLQMHFIFISSFILKPAQRTMCWNIHIKKMVFAFQQIRWNGQILLIFHVYNLIN